MFWPAVGAPSVRQDPEATQGPHVLLRRPPDHGLHQVVGPTPVPVFIAGRKIFQGGKDLEQVTGTG